MSFEKATELNKKTDKFFGLDKTESSLRPQKAGYLYKRPFFKVGGIWRKRYFAVKDSFMFWYDTDTGVAFDTKPNGCMPLGGAAVRLMNDGLTIELTHPAFARGGQKLVCRASDKLEAQEWINIIKAGMNATWDNALVGFALMEKMKAKGTALEAEKDAALQRIQAETERLRQEREESERLAAHKMATENELEEELSKVAEQLAGLKHSVSKGEEEFRAVKSEHEMERQRKQEVLEQLKMAQSALLALEKAFEAQQKDSKGKTYADAEEVKKSVSALKGFFEKNIQINERRRAALEVKKR